MVSIKGKKDYIVALESVAMTDIVLNMFIFFFISFSLLYTFSPTRISKIDVKLPEASSAVSIEGSERTILTIDRYGEHYINDEKVKGSDLGKQLERRLRLEPDLSLLLKVDGMAKFNSVVKVLDIINALNIRKVSIMTVKKE